MPMRPIRFGFGLTAMSGPSGNWRKPASAMKLSTTGSALVNPAALQKICDRLGPGAVKNFFWRWLHRLPSPFTSADWKVGYVYELAFRQFEVSDTCVFDRPHVGRMWFEGVIRDHLDLGRPDQIMLIFDRRLGRSTPGLFRTRVLTKGVDPTLCCYYKSSRLKQYFKQGRALRTETVICDTQDFGIGRLVCAKRIGSFRNNHDKTLSVLGRNAQVFEESEHVLPDRFIVFINQAPILGFASGFPLTDASENGTEHFRGE